MHETLILTRRDVAAAMDLSAWLEAVETGFAAQARGEAWSPLPMHIEGEGGGFHAKGAALRLGRLYVAVKINGNFPGNPATLGLPTIQGAILLSDGSDGRLLAIMDSIEVTIRRTAAATALAARYLARPESATALVCGCGEQGRAQLEAVSAVLPLARAFACDLDAAKAQRFAEEYPGLPVSAVTALAPASRATDVILACTPARTPYLSSEMVAPGTFVAAVGADSEHKNELAPDLFEDTLVVADVLEQCLAMGDLRHAVAAGAISPAAVHAELADLVAGRAAGRSSPEQIAVFDSTGTALQDVAAAARIYERCVDDASRVRVALGSRSAA